MTMREDKELKPWQAGLIIALVMMAAGTLSISLGLLGKWTGVREPLQLSRATHPLSDQSGLTR